jgi:hypothetical protein
MWLVDAGDAESIREAAHAARDLQRKTDIIEDGSVIAAIVPVPAPPAQDTPDEIEQGIATASRLSAELGLELSRIRDLVSQQRG